MPSPFATLSQLSHPDVHRPWANWSEDQTLHVAVAYSNPFRWRTRRELANNCIRHLRAAPNVVVHVGELAYGDRPFELTGDNITDVQLRIDRNETFSKENIQNLVVRTFPQDYQYGAAIDADFHFTRHDWALETIHQLQHYKIVQMFSSYVDLSGNDYGQGQVPVRYNSGFFFNFIQNGYQVSPQYHNGFIDPITGNRITAAAADEAYDHAMGLTPEQGRFMRGVGATGGAYAWRRSTFDTLGGFLDRCILGHADWYLAYSLLDIEPPDIHSQKYHPNYKHYVGQYRERARALLKNVGYVDGHCIHYWHGSKTRRAYSSRDAILAKHQYSPYEDVFPTHQGIWQLNPAKIGLRDDIRQYFMSRGEDNPNLASTDRLLV